jgi:cell division protein FtsL
MRIFNAFDKKNLPLLVLILLMVAAIGLIWLYYDRELEIIEGRKNDFNNKRQLKHSNSIYRQLE